MKIAAEREEMRLILAVVYTDGIAADRFLARLGYRLREAGIPVAGLVQRNTFVPGRDKCDMEVEELSSGTVLQISEYRGNGAAGCRLNRGALAEALGLLKTALARNPAILILNKFGKVEMEGGGLREAIGEAVELGFPVVAGVPVRNLNAWREFAGDLAVECGVDVTQVRKWLFARNIVWEAGPAAG
jgi:hypothetical protein